MAQKTLNEHWVGGTSLIAAGTRVSVASGRDFDFRQVRVTVVVSIEEFHHIADSLCTKSLYIDDASL